MAPPPSNAVSLPPTTAAPPPPLPAIPLSLRALTFIAVLISVVLTATAASGSFSHFSAYSYMFSCGVIGMIYTFLQVGFTLYRTSTGNQLLGEGSTLFDFYGDKAFSYLLATGTAAGFGLAVDARDSNYYGSASLLLIGFMFSTASSLFSSFSLPNKP